MKSHEWHLGYRIGFLVGWAIGLLGAWAGVIVANRIL